MTLFFGFFELFFATLCYFCISAYRQRNELIFEWPVVGMLPALSGSVDLIHERCTDILRWGRGTFMFKGPWLAGMDMLATVDPANVHHIMSTNFLNFPKGDEFRTIFDVLGDGIFNSDHELWRTHRRLTTTIINQPGFLRFLSRTSHDKVARGLVPVLDHAVSRDSVVDMQDVFQRLTFDGTCMFVTGYDPGCLSPEFEEIPFAKAMDEAEEAIFVRHVIPKAVWRVQNWLGIGKEKRMKQAWATLDGVINEFISRKRGDLKNAAAGKEGDAAEGGGGDVLSALMREYEGFDDKFLRDTVLNLMIAGRDTTSSALTWLLWLVVSNPTVEEKIREEVEGLLAGDEKGKRRVFHGGETAGLVYLHAAICEALRLYPPVPFQHKAPVRPDVLPTGHRVHPKMKILFSLYAMGRMETIWGKDCLEFKPERWITDKRTIRHEPSYKFLTFNAGPRTCLGKQVAFTQMKAVAATVLHNYNFKMIENHHVAPNVSIILYMKYGLKVRVASRWP